MKAADAIALFSCYRDSPSSIQNTVTRRAIASFVKDLTNDPVTYKDRWGINEKTYRKHLNAAKNILESLNER